MWVRQLSSGLWACGLLDALFFSVEGSVPFGLFVSSSVALLAHKITVILLYLPLGVLDVILRLPFLFAFDLITLIVLHRALRSARKFFRIIGAVVCGLIISCSSMFISLSWETDAAVNRPGNAEVHPIENNGDVQFLSNRKTFGKIIMRGRGGAFTSFAAFVATGCFLALLRKHLDNTKFRRVPPEMFNTTALSGFPKFICTRLVQFILVLLVGSLCIRSQPWKQMTSTLMLDIVGNIGSVLTPKLHRIETTPGYRELVVNYLGTLNYTPADDPYYISNLDEPVIDFIADALEGVKFKHIVHIVLESMRADSFPFQENSHLVNYIRSNFPPHVNGTPITTANISPFIASLVEHTISWETMWTHIPWTHKAIIARRLSPFP